MSPSSLGNKATDKRGLECPSALYLILIKVEAIPYEALSLHSYGKIAFVLTPSMTSWRPGYRKQAHGEPENF
jgi:hypothetical protein